MRESNFSNAAQNKACICVSAAVYDRRALDCTAKLPLINSLNHLAYLTSTSPRVREMVTVDSGLERLIRILRDVPKASGVGSSRGTTTKEMHAIWQWSLAFQCVVNIGVRGSEAVRTRVVEAGMVPITIKVLESHLLLAELARAEQHKLDVEQKRREWLDDDTRRGALHEELILDAATAALAARRSADEASSASTLSLPASGHTTRDGVRHTHLTTRVANQDLASRPSTPAEGEVSVAPTIFQRRGAAVPMPILGDLGSGMVVDVDQAQQSVNMTATSPSSSADDIPATLDMSRSASTSSATPLTANRAGTLTNVSSVEDFAASGSGSEGAEDAEMSFADEAEGDEADHEYDRASAPASFASQEGDANSRTADMDERQTPRPSRRVLAPLGTLSQGDAGRSVTSSTDATVNPFHGNGEVSRQHAVRIPILPTEQPIASTPRGPREQLTSPTPRGQQHALSGRPTRQHAGPVGSADPQSAPGQLDTRERPFATPTQALEERLNAAAPTETQRLQARTGGADLQAQPTIRPEFAATTPRGPNAAFIDRARTQRSQLGDIIYREEEVLLSLQLLAYLSKYAHVRALFHHSELATHALPGSLEELDSLYGLRRGADGSSRGKSWDPHQPTKPNVFSIAEAYTLRGSRSGSATPTSHLRLAQEIQYWAGVIMRNACRKDEARGGIRQCANMLCGKWEAFPREFAKCRRCRKAKYCSKQCQSKGWSTGHRFWCSARSDDVEAREKASSAAISATVTGPQRAAAEVADAAQAGADVAQPHRHETARQNLAHAATHHDRPPRFFEAETRQEFLDATHLHTPVIDSDGVTALRPRPSGLPQRLAAQHPGRASPHVRPSSSSSTRTSLTSDASDDERERQARSGEGSVNPSPLSRTSTGHDEDALGHSQPAPPQRTDLAGRPLPPPVIAQHDGAAGLNQDLMALGGRLTPNIEEAVDTAAAFGTGDFDQMMWRGRTPAPSDAGEDGGGTEDEQVRPRRDHLRHLRYRTETESGADDESASANEASSNPVHATLARQPHRFASVAAGNVPIVSHHVSMRSAGVEAPPPHLFAGSSSGIGAGLGVSSASTASASNRRAHAYGGLGVRRLPTGPASAYLPRSASGLASAPAFARNFRSEEDDDDEERDSESHVQQQLPSNLAVTSRPDQRESVDGTTRVQPSARTSPMQRSTSGSASWTWQQHSNISPPSFWQDGDADMTEQVVVSRCEGDDCCTSQGADVGACTPNQWHDATTATMHQSSDIQNYRVARALAETVSAPSGSALTSVNSITSDEHIVGWEDHGGFPVPIYAHQVAAKNRKRNFATFRRQEASTQFSATAWNAPKNRLSPPTMPTSVFEPIDAPTFSGRLHRNGVGAAYRIDASAMDVDAER
ncbi:related to protein [Ceraceosorus bombacis]|uniref:Related to protein n=1 Tax=Ceraceosorus bombacis TaxID=401625 RepID=A0A0P1BIY1_9BASI|nr:related to protein [Ceraceosorus bombacis]